MKKTTRVANDEGERATRKIHRKRENEGKRKWENGKRSARDKDGQRKAKKKNIDRINLKNKRAIGSFN